MDLSLSLSHPEFSQFLHEFLGIEKNIFTVVEARRSAKQAGSHWQETCESWGESCPIGLERSLSRDHGSDGCTSSGSKS